MSTSTAPYFSYLLRLWLAGNEGQPEWRLALIDPQTNEQHGFASLEALTTFLQTRMQVTAHPEAEERPAPHRFEEGNDEE
jgi:hypothetical protein